MSTLVRPIVTSVVIPGQTGGAFTQSLNVPDNTIELYGVGLSLATLATTMVTIATNIQLITSPTGGINVKDSLDPYAYSIVTQALAANGQPVPAGAPDSAVASNPLGGAVAAAGALAAAASTAASLGASVAQELFVEPSVTEGNGATVGAFPDYSGAITLINSSIVVINTAVSQIAFSLNSSIDILSQSLVLKGVLSAFNINLNAQAIAQAGRTPPTAPSV